MQFDFSNENIASLGTPISLLQYYDLELRDTQRIEVAFYTQTLNIAYYNYLGCLPINVAADNRYSVYLDQPGFRTLVYNYITDTFHVFEVGNGHYYSDPRLKVVNVYNLQQDTFNFEFWKLKKWYSGNPSFHNWIDSKTPAHRSVTIKGVHGNHRDPTILEVTIHYRSGDCNLQFKGNGFFIHDAFNAAFAQMRMILMSEKSEEIR